MCISLPPSPSYLCNPLNTPNTLPPPPNTHTTPTTQVQVKPAFDPALLSLREQLSEGTERMQALAQQMATRLGLVTKGEGRVRLDYRCVSVFCVYSGV